MRNGPQAHAPGTVLASTGPYPLRWELLFWDGVAIYWDTVARWITLRARRDASALGVPLVFLLSADECNTINGEAARRLLSVANVHNTGHIPGVLPAHIGMRVRFLANVNSTMGLAQEQRATIVVFIFHEADRRRYDATAPGVLFRPRYLPAAYELSTTSRAKLTTEVVQFHAERLQSFLPCKNKIHSGLSCPCRNFRVGPIA